MSEIPKHQKHVGKSNTRVKNSLCSAADGGATRADRDSTGKQVYQPVELLVSTLVDWKEQYLFTCARCEKCLKELSCFWLSLFFWKAKKDPFWARRSMARKNSSWSILKASHWSSLLSRTEYFPHQQTQLLPLQWSSPSWKRSKLHLQLHSAGVSLRNADFWS